MAVQSAETVAFHFKVSIQPQSRVNHTSALVRRQSFVMNMESESPLADVPAIEVGMQAVWSSCIRTLTLGPGGLEMLPVVPS
jgi:hypothetical protein